MTRSPFQNVRRIFAYPAMIAALGVAGTRVQAQTPAVTDPQTQTTAFDQLLATQPPLDAPYTLGRGDAVSIAVQGRPELTGRQTIGPDGSVTLPLIGSINVIDKTRDDAAEAIRVALLTYYTHPVVTVSVDSYNSNRILLVGSVASPGVMVFDHTPTLLEVLARGGSATHGQSGGLRDGANRGGGGYGGVNNGGGETLPDKVVIYRGTDTVMRLDVHGLVASGNAMANLRLKRDDTVYVPSGSERYVSVLGQVIRPGSQVLESNTTLVQLLADSGGLDPRAGKNPTIEIIEPSTGKKRQIQFNALLNPKSSEVHLQAGDIVYIPQSGFNAASYTLNQLSPLFTLFTTAALLDK